MSEDEFFVMMIALFFGIASATRTRTSSLPALFTNDNPGIGMMRLSVICSLAWAVVVIRFFGDESIRGIYLFFYLLMAYTVTKCFGQMMGAAIFSLHLRSDVYERRNTAAAIFVAGFTLATGIIFGGSLWGDADPVGDGDGGWWIPLGFFLMGWGVLVVSTALYLWREPGCFALQIRQERDAGMAWSTAVYMLSTASLILEGVAGDFWGWRHGLLGMGTIAFMLVAHELFVAMSAQRGEPVEIPAAKRFVERIFYIGMAAGAWAANRYIESAFGGG